MCPEFIFGSCTIKRNGWNELVSVWPHFHLKKKGEHLFLSLTSFFPFIPLPLSELWHLSLLPRAPERCQQLWSPFPVKYCGPSSLPVWRLNPSPFVSLAAVCLSLSGPFSETLVPLICKNTDEREREKRGRKGGRLCALVVPRSFLEYDRYFGLAVKS